MLFVAGKLLGGREEVVELSRTGRLKEAITSALPETMSEEAKKVHSLSSTILLA